MFYSTALGGWHVWFEMTPVFSLASHLDFKIPADLDRHPSTARSAQPQIFISARLARVFQLDRRLTPRESSFGVDEIEFPFAEIAKHSGTVWIGALSKHGIFERSHESRAFVQPNTTARLALDRGLKQLDPKRDSESIGRWY
jgi:hypothetical protein